MGFAALYPSSIFGLGLRVTEGRLGRPVWLLGELTGIERCFANTLNRLRSAHRSGSASGDPLGIGEQLVDFAFSFGPILDLVSGLEAALLGAVVGRFVNHVPSFLVRNIGE